MLADYAAITTCFRIVELQDPSDEARSFGPEQVLLPSNVGLLSDRRYNRPSFYANFWLNETPMPHSLIVTASRIAAVIVLLHCGTVLAEGDIEAGKVTAYTCTGCHGIPGYNNIYPTYKVPKIAGQNYEYLVSALKAYRNGERDHPTMEVQSSSLSDEDIENVSAYIASIGKD